MPRKLRIQYPWGYLSCRESGRSSGDHSANQVDSRPASNGARKSVTTSLQEWKRQQPIESSGYTVMGDPFFNRMNLAIKVGVLVL
jgi:hypothetical protein